MLSFSVRMDASLQYGCVQTKVEKDSSTQIAMTTLRDWLSVLWKETRIAIVIGGALAVITLGKVSLLSYGVELPANLTLTMLGCAIGLALFFQIVSSTVIGAMLPMMTKRLNLDPAVYFQLQDTSDPFPEQ